MEQHAPVTIVFSSDNNHAMLLGVVLCSLFENKRGDYAMNVFVLDGGISDMNKARMKELEDTYHFSITYAVPDAAWFEGISTDARPIAAYYRAAIDRLVPATCKRAVYLDCDILIEGDIKELFEFDLEGKTAGAVADHPQGERREYLKKLSGLDGDYFNSGVLLIDLDLWRQKEIGKKLFSFIRANPDKLFFADRRSIEHRALR